MIQLCAQKHLQEESIYEWNSCEYINIIGKLFNATAKVDIHDEIIFKLNPPREFFFFVENRTNLIRENDKI